MATNRIYDEIKLSERVPVSIIPVENGYKVYQSRDMYAYPNPKPAETIPNNEYVFNALEDVFAFLTEHFEQL